MHISWLNNEKIIVTQVALAPRAYISDFVFTRTFFMHVVDKISSTKKNDCLYSEWKINFNCRELLWRWQRIIDESITHDSGRAHTEFHELFAEGKLFRIANKRWWAEAKDTSWKKESTPRAGFVRASPLFWTISRHITKDRHIVIMFDNRVQRDLERRGFQQWGFLLLNLATLTTWKALACE